MSAASSKSKPSASHSSALVALSGWLIPGGGYALLGDYTRAITVGLTIVLLFISGLLIAGVRVLEVPGYGPHGRKIIVSGDAADRDSISEEDESGAGPSRGWIMQVHPLDEIRNKPWSIAQVMNGPMGVLGGAASVWASQRPASGAAAPGVRSHARVNEIGVLYTAVAGMLNLLAIIDAAHRAGEPKVPA